MLFDFQYVTSLAAPHIDSYNFFLGPGLLAALEHLPPVEFEIENGDRLSISVLVSSISWCLITWIMEKKLRRNDRLCCIVSFIM